MASLIVKYSTAYLGDLAAKLRSVEPLPCLTGGVVSVGELEDGGKAVEWAAVMVRSRRRIGRYFRTTNCRTGKSVASFDYNYSTA